MASGYTQQEIEKMAAEIESLRSQLSAKEEVVSKLESGISKLESDISKLEFELTWLRKKLFGKMSERFISSDPDSRQLDIFGDQLSDKEREELERAAEQEQELITRTITSSKPRTPRKDVSFENLRVEETVIAIGRKNYLFCGNSEAAIRAAMVYSLLGSCKAAGVNPTEWLEDVLSKMYSYSKGKGNLEILLPHLWRKE